MFVNDEWISSIAHSMPYLFYSLDIRRMISSQLQLIASQCRSAKQIIRDILQSVGSNQLFVPTMISQDTLDVQVDIITNEVKNKFITTQSQIRNLINDAYQQDQIFSALSSNYLYQNIDGIGQGYYSVK